ncbi:MAG TPA: antibiotic biosynthesis monooxygenase [Candidatus Hydrogenedentes bacterium]|nr:antibiotic biosynthesis monooxygenase [Candidatus Hydrogenedentota bacterium]HPG68174.1 antibiotic biosynthesis monooxygenase [Candidatus Hydrogenedentota bacterium]
MVTFIARLKIIEGKEDEALGRLKEMVQTVRGNEPGALVYCCHRCAYDPLEIVFYEMYADEAAKDAHMTTPYLDALLSLLGDVFDDEFGVQVEDLVPVALHGQSVSE